MLISTSFNFNDLDSTVYEGLLSAGYLNLSLCVSDSNLKIVEEIVHHQVKNGLHPKSSTIRALVATLITPSYLKEYPSFSHLPRRVEPFALLVKNYPETEIWEPLVRELLSADQFPTCMAVLLIMPLTV